MASGLRFEEGETQTGLAPHVIIGHCDVASAGVRTVLLLREALHSWVGADKTVSAAGSVSAPAEEDEGEDGAAQDCRRAWDCTAADVQMSPAAALQTDTFHDADGAAVVSLVCINAQFSLRGANAIALDLVRKVVADKVQSVTVVAGARFNPKDKADSRAAHLLQIRRGATVSSPTAPLPCWDAACEIKDSLLAAVLQLLILERDVATDCLMAPAYRLPQEISLNLPTAAHDPTTEAIGALYGSLEQCNAARALVTLGGGRQLPALDGAALGKMRPACALNVGEFAPVQPDSSESLYK